MLSGMSSTPERTEPVSYANDCLSGHCSNGILDLYDSEMDTYLNGSKQCIEILSVVVDKLFGKI
ncbi:MAG: hypothetical protein A4E66_00179 [Syntrophus sp. PtaB.Bin001]|nr:MAG: hypothetical protein A4E66_00179 [Syntrophus sp. PtaB.Bin001]